MKDGFTPIEYFITTHGSRKGLTDTALNTAKAGYLTRRLFVVAQDTIVTEEDCGTKDVIIIKKEGFSGMETSIAKSSADAFLAKTSKTKTAKVFSKKVICSPNKTLKISKTLAFPKFAFARRSPVKLLAECVRMLRNGSRQK